MVRPKIPTKRARNAAAGEGSSRNPPRQSRESSQREEPRTFVGSYQKMRYEQIINWSIIKERRVELKDGEFSEFNDELGRRKWGKLAAPPVMFDVSIVMEFYANAWPGLEHVGPAPRVSVVRGVPIPYDRDAISNFLGNPLPLSVGETCTFAAFRDTHPGICPWSVSDTLCRAATLVKSGEEMLRLSFCGKK